MSYRQVWFHEAGTPQKRDHCPNGEGHPVVESLGKIFRRRFFPSKKGPDVWGDVWGCQFLSAKNGASRLPDGTHKMSSSQHDSSRSLMVNSLEEKSESIRLELRTSRSLTFVRLTE